MSKVRIVNDKGDVRFVTKRVSEKTQLLKSKGFWIEEIAKPEEASVKEEAPKKVPASVEATPTEDVQAPDLNAPTYEELKAEYKVVFGKKPHHSWKEETLTQKIEDKKNG